MTINKCSRSGDIIEPLLLPQWFIDTPPLSSSVLESINNNELSIFPPTYKNDCIRWLSHPQPWCISRQIKWGHKIPAYKVIDNNNNKELGWIVCNNKEDIEKECNNKFNKSINKCNIIQDSDVLDTWFSSCILPLSTSNWPNNIDHNKYPLSLMETGNDILFFWVLRQAILCKKLSNELPFKTVYLHPIVRDSTGRKMSKSLGNVIDPLNVIYGITKEKMIDNLLTKSNLSTKELEKSIKLIKSQYPNGIESSGLDTLRFCLISYLKQSRSINLDINSIKSSKRFCNKLWNAMKYFEINKVYCVESLTNKKISDNYPLPLHSMWILSKLSHLIESVNINMKNYSFYNVTNELVQFFLHDFCDKYLLYIIVLLYLVIWNFLKLI